jgi:hypothetical protein
LAKLQKYLGWRLRKKEMGAVGLGFRLNSWKKDGRTINSLADYAKTAKTTA